MFSNLSESHHRVSLCIFVYTCLVIRVIRLVIRVSCLVIRVAIACYACSSCPSNNSSSSVLVVVKVVVVAVVRIGAAASTRVAISVE